MIKKILKRLRNKFLRPVLDQLSLVDKLYDLENKLNAISDKLSLVDKLYDLENNVNGISNKLSLTTDKIYKLHFPLRSPVFFHPISTASVNFSARNPLATHKKLILSPKSV